MSSNEKQILESYGFGKVEDGRENLSRYAGIEFHYTKKHLAPYIDKSKTILEVGCATGYYGMYYADKCKEYVGIDIVPAHIEIFSDKIKDAGFDNVFCSVGDATNLSHIPAESYDVVLCLGPMYHLPCDERKQAMMECKRVCKSGGILAFAYISKIGCYAGACVHDELRKYYPSELANINGLIKNTDDKRPGIFYYSTPEDMNALAKECGLTKIKNLGTDFFITMSIVNNMTDEQFELLKPLYDNMTSFESCTGMANHALLVCQKP